MLLQTIVVERLKIKFDGNWKKEESQVFMVLKPCATFACSDSAKYIYVNSI